MASNEHLAELERWATSRSAPDLKILRAKASVDESEDGSEITRIVLLLSDPDQDTWSVPTVRDLRLEFGKKATELDLPPVSLSLIPESEEEDLKIFSG